MDRTLVLLLILLLTIGGYVTLQNYRVNNAEHRVRQAETDNARLASALAEAQLKERVVTRYIDRVQVVRERGANIAKEVPVHVTQAADARCTVPIGFVRLHNAAADNLPAPESTGSPDAPAAGIALSDVATTVAGNYTSCHATAAQVIALQDYVRALQQVGER